VIELKRCDKEKRARRILTRPKPTIIGNCEGWSFIVGKKPATYSPKICHHEPLQCSNKNFIHSLLTISMEHHLDNLWVNCGLPVNQFISYRIVDFGNFNMPAICDDPTLF
jgi:hypothetical protein